MADEIENTSTRAGRAAAWTAGTMSVIVLLCWAVSHFPSGLKVGASTSTTSSAAMADPATFGSSQNDVAGYSGHSWGEVIAYGHGSIPDSTFIMEELRDSDSRVEEHELQTIFNVPSWSDITGVHDRIMPLNWTVIPNKFQTVEDGDCKYIYYGGVLTMAYVQIDAHQAEPAIQALEAKYTQVGEDSVNWPDPRSDSPADGTTLNIRLFRRGETNTRIYLLQRIDHDSDLGSTITTDHLLYVPTHYMWTIQHDIQELVDQYRTKYQAEAQEAAQQAIQPNLEKVQ